MALQVSEPRMEFHIMVKCFNMFTDRVNDQSRHYRVHCGEHTVITEECINSYSFRRMLDDCLERAHQLSTTQNTINVVCCDYEGTRESVAMASILCAVLEIKDCKTAGPYHLCKGQWREKICVAAAGGASNTKKRTRCSVQWQALCEWPVSGEEPPFSVTRNNP